jgi:hypothetical protein
VTLDTTLAKETVDDLQLRLMQHQVERPLTSDPGFVKWCETKDAIKFHLELKQIEAREAWKPAPGPAHPRGPGFSPNRPTVAELQPEPKSAPPPISEPETPVTNKLKKDMTEEELEAKRAYQRRWLEKKRAKDAAPKRKAKAKPEKVAEAPRKAKAAPPTPSVREGLGRPLEAAIDLGRAIQRHVTTPAKIDDVRTHIRGIRRQVWSLLADLENLTVEQRRQIEPEVAMLDAAVSTAYNLTAQTVAV